MDDFLEDWLWLWPLWLVLGGMLIYFWVVLVAVSLELLCRMLEQGDCPKDEKDR